MLKLTTITAAVLYVSAVSCNTAPAQDTTRTVTIYRYPDGRVARVVIEESPPAVRTYTPQTVRPVGCPTCGPACDCPACGCDANSWVASCAAAPRIVATAPPAPPVILPAAPQPPVYYVSPPYYAQPMPSYRPLFSAGVQFRGPFGGGFSSAACVGGG